jgi:hypothetical protein
LLIDNILEKILLAVRYLQNIGNIYYKTIIFIDSNIKSAFSNDITTNYFSILLLYEFKRKILEFGT